MPPIGRPDDPCRLQRDRPALAALLAPSWFADTAGFPRHTHFVHDAGAFQLGIGVTLFPAVAWRDGLACAACRLGLR